MWRLQAIIKDAESRLPRYQAAVTTGIDPTTGKAADVEVARAGLINQQTNIQHAQAAIAELTAQMEEEKKVRDKAKAAYDANDAAITKLTEEYNKLVEQIQSAKGTAAITGGLSGTGGAFSAVEKAIQDARRGQGTANDADAITSLKDLLNNIGLNGSAIIQYLATSGNLHQAVLNEITVANRRIEQLAQQIAHSPPAPGP
jgi:recombinational DNA repair protein (RecF pathway)